MEKKFGIRDSTAVLLDSLFLLPGNGIWFDNAYLPVFSEDTERFALLPDIHQYSTRSGHTALNPSELHNNYDYPQMPIISTYKLNSLINYSYIHYTFSIQ